MQEMPRLATGFVLDGRYRVDDLISVGGMGAVYSGTHVFLRKKVAIKVLRSDLPSAHLMVDRFQREAIAASAIGHENIIQVTDMGVTPDGIAYLVMELLSGRGLGDAIKHDAPFAVGHACRLATEMLRGLGAAHQAGIVHRDLKPDNVFLVPRDGGEMVKLLDFGVSLLKRADLLPDTRLTTNGMIVGTPRYMSPEQARGEADITGSADIYATGVVLYEMLVGVLPYPAEHYNVVVHQIISGEWIPLDGRRADLPGALVTHVHRALALQPEDRFASADEFAAALMPFADVAARPTGSSTAHRRAPRPVELEPTRAIPPADRPTPPPAADPSRIMTASASDSLTREPEWAEAGRMLKTDPNARRTASGMFSADEHDVPERRRRSRWPLFLIVAGVAGAGAYLALRGYGGPGRHPGSEPLRGSAAADAAPAKPRADAAPPPDARPKPSAKPDAAPVKPKPSPSPSPSAAPKADKVTLELIVMPPGAAIDVDGEPVDAKRVTVKRGKKKVKVRAASPGYVTQTVTVVPDKDREVFIQLKKKMEAPPPDETAPSPAPSPEPSPAPAPAPPPP